MPYSAKACEDAAKAAGLTLGGAGYPFNSNDATVAQKGAYNPGCYHHHDGNYAFYGDSGTNADKKTITVLKAGQSRVPGADCGTFW